MRARITSLLAVLGPGLAVAATGVGAGDVVTASVSGALYGTAILWAAVIGAVLKFALNEGIARWQLATDTTLLQGWGRHLRRPVIGAFLIYLLIWTYLVAGALISACGVAAHSVIPALGVEAWGIIHSLIAAVLVLFGRYTLFERVMKVFIGLMFVTVVTSAILVRPDLGSVLQGLFVPSIPDGSGKFLLGVIGGVGGSVTLLSYSYWIQERGWKGRYFASEVRLDLGVAYLLTAIFGLALIVVAADLRPEVMTGSEMALEIAGRIEEVAGGVGRWVFLVGFWGTVFTSMLGVWQGVPYIFADTINILRYGKLVRSSAGTDSVWYRGYVFFIALPPMTLLLLNEPVWVILIYSIAGAVFMPFLAGTLLILNNRRKLIGSLRNGILINLLLAAALVLFMYLCVREIIDTF